MHVLELLHRVTFYMKPCLKMILAAALAVWVTSALAQEAIGVVKRTHGSAVIERAGARLPAARGVQILKGDRIVTGAKGYVDITMRGAALNVGPHANVAMDRFVPDQTHSAQSSVPPMLQALASLLSVNRLR